MRHFLHTASGRFGAAALAFGLLAFAIALDCVHCFAMAQRARVVAAGDAHACCNEEHAAEAAHVLAQGCACATPAGLPEGLPGVSASQSEGRLPAALVALAPAFTLLAPEAALPTPLRSASESPPMATTYPGILERSISLLI